MELMVSLAVILILVLGVYSLITLSLQLSSDNLHYTEATEIANLKMEEIRNLAYDDVGTVSGSPPGLIPDYETITREGTYTVHTTVMFYDDPYDGTIASGTDAIFVDYKIATVQVSWQSKHGTKTVTVFSKIIPNTIETLTGYGILILSVVDASGQAVPGADIHIENPNKSLNVDLISNSEGKLFYPVLPDMEAYEITVTKEDYGTDATHDRDAGNPNPSKPHLSVFDGAKTEESFSIDKLAHLTIKTVSMNQSDNWQVNENSSNNSKFVQADTDNSGNIYFAWQNYNATSSKVLIQKYDNSFAKQWTNDLEIYNTKFQTNPDIASADNGQFFIVWQDNSLTLKQITYNSNIRLAENFKKKNIYPNLALLFKDFFKKDFFNFINILKNSNKTKKVYAASDTVTLVGVGPGSSTGSSHSITLTKPAGTQNGDLMLAFIHQDDRSDGPIIPPSGWNILDDYIYISGSKDDHRGGLWWKIAGASEPSSYTFSLSGGNEQKAGHIRTYRGVDPSDPFASSLSITSTADGDVLRGAPSNTVAKDGSMLVCGWGTDTSALCSGSPSYPSGMGNTICNYGWGRAAASADMPVNASDSPTGIKYFDAGQYVGRRTFNWSLVLQPNIIPDDVTVSASGSQISTILSPSSDQYLGGKFIFTDNTGSHNITKIKIKESGSVDASSSLSNIKLFYDLDTTAPYDCADEQYDAGIDSQFGVATSSFSSADGYAEFNESLGVNIDTTKTMCLYVVLDVSESANKDENIEIEIEDPSTDIELASGTVIPATTVEISQSTLIQKPSNLVLDHYRWRNDDGDESSATWAEEEDTPINILSSQNIRLRFEVSNQGSLSSSNTFYQLEYGTTNGNCDAVSSWTAVPSDNSQDWALFDSSYFIDGNNTTDSIALSNEASNFEAGYIQDQSNPSSGIILDGDEFTEVEFSIKPTASANDSTYCFRLTDMGDDSKINIDSYAQVNIVGDENIYIKSYDQNGNLLWGVKRINTESGDQDQTYPRIALTENFGNATTTIVWQDYRNSNWDIYAQSFDKNGNKLWVNDLLISASSSNEYRPVIAFDNQDNFIVAWTSATGTISNVYAQKFDLNGNKIWSENKKLSSSSTKEYYPQIAVSDNDFYLVWTELDSTETVYLSKYNASGTREWIRKANRDDVSGRRYDGNLMVKGSYVYVSWTDERNGNQDIYLQKYSFDGNPEYDEDLKLNIETGANTQEKSTLFFNSAGKTLSAWQDNRNGVFDIYATEFVSPGTPAPVASVPLLIQGTKQIGDNPVILEYDRVQSTDGAGSLTLNLEWDNPGYTIDTYSASTSLSVSKTNPSLPIQLNPDESKIIYIYVK